MKILITGGAGYIGTELTYQLAKIDSVSEIVVYDNLNRTNYNFFIGKPYPGSTVRFVEGEILDSRLLREVLKGVDVVYHLAARVSTPFSSQDPHFFEQVNHWGTAELSYAIEESNVQKVIYTSSTSVYGASAKKVMKENTPINPRTYYGISKMRGEQQLDRLKKKINTLIIRCGNIYGYNPSMRYDAVINRFMFDAHFKNKITINGNGKQARAFIHVAKAAAALAKMSVQEIPSGTYNLVDKNISVLDISRVVNDLYPNLEMTFVNQHLTLRNLEVNPEGKLAKYNLIKESDLKEELQAFRKKFVFH